MMGHLQSSRLTKLGTGSESYVNLPSLSRKLRKKKYEAQRVALVVIKKEIWHREISPGNGNLSE